MQSTAIDLDDIAPRYVAKTKARPGNAEHAFIAGLTGSGKTVLLSRLLSRVAYPVVHDAKGTIHWGGYKRYSKLRDVVESKQPRLIYAPSRRELRDRPTQEAFFEWIYQRGNTTVAIDETYALTDGSEMPDAYWDCLSRGRELGIAVYSCTQRPMWIPNIIISEARNTYIFYLRLETDCKKVAAVIPVSSEQIHGLEEHAFYYYREGAREALGPLRLRL